MIDLSTGAPKRHVLERFPGLDAPDDAAPGEARSAPPGPGFVDARRSFEWKQIPLVLVVEAAGGSLWAAQSGRGRA